MKYILEKNKSWGVDPNEWEQCIKYYTGLRLDWDDLPSAISSMKRNYTELARWIWPLRIVNEEGYIFCVYDPERDMRLPGCRWRKVQRDAFDLWEQAGRPDGQSDYFWSQAELNIKDCDGVFEVDGEYVFNAHLDQG